jgi:hypothetical protein
MVGVSIRGTGISDGDEEGISEDSVGTTGTITGMPVAGVGDTTGTGMSVVGDAAGDPLQASQFVFKKQQRSNHIGARVQ